MLTVLKFAILDFFSIFSVSLTSPCSGDIAVSKTELFHCYLQTAGGCWKGGKRYNLSMRKAQVEHFYCPLALVSLPKPIFLWNSHNCLTGAPVDLGHNAAISLMKRCLVLSQCCSEFIKAERGRITQLQH